MGQLVDSTRFVILFMQMTHRFESGLRLKNAAIAQLVEQLICNQPVVGSSPTSGSKMPL